MTKWSHYDRKLTDFWHRLAARGRHENQPRFAKTNPTHAHRARARGKNRSSRAGGRSTKEKTVRRSGSRCSSANRRTGETKCVNVKQVKQSRSLPKKDTSSSSRRIFSRKKSSATLVG